jgi:Rieske Fe-S protein
VFPIVEFVEFRWSGQVMEPADGVAFIGLDPAGEANVYVVTGDSGNGMTHGTLAGMLLTDLIDGRDNPWAEIYDPKRKPLKALGEYTKENLDVAKQLIVDYVRGGDVDSADAVPRGQGAVIRRGLQKVAVYRDEDGEAHEFSAVCPHLSCIVHWNPTEKTWDCPCHGSRFDCLGKVVNGPANQDLTPADDQEPEETAPAGVV